jgi:NADH:ubiquinone oxidoreductase subunit 5 (subunit L)/multisubunit Na+/H+ antiporter MnhA subunit
VGYITLFLGLAGLLANQKAGYEEALVLGFGGALLHMYNHGFSKAQLLFDSGVMIKVSHAEDLNLMGALAKRLPIMKVSFVIGALSLGLIPATFGVRTLRELVFNNNIPSLAKLVVIATAGLSLIACLSVWYCCFFSRSNIQSDDHPKVPRTMYLPGLLMGGLIILVGSYFTLEWAGLISSGSNLADTLRILAETTIKSSVGA